MANIATKEDVKPTEDPAAKLLAQYDLATESALTPPITAPVEEPAAQPVAEPVAPVVEKPKLPSWLARAAREARLDPADVAEMSADDVKEAILLKSQVNREVQDSRDQNRALNSAGRPYDPKTGQLLPVNPEPSATLAEKEFNLKDLGIDEARLAAFDPDFAKLISDVAKPLHARNKLLEDRLKQMEDGQAEISRREQQRSAHEALNQLDKLFSEHEAVFGKGAREELDQDGDEYMRRGMVARAMQINSANDPTLSFKKNFERASKAILGLAAPAPEPKVEDDKGYRNGQLLAPSSRSEPAPKRGDAATIAALARHRQDLIAVAGREEDDLPDKRV